MQNNQPNVVEILSNIAKLHPNKLAIVDKTASITYANLELAVRKTARQLLDKGIQHQDRVLVLVPLSIDLYRVTMALNYIGAAPIFIEDWITFRQISACCEAAQPKAIVTNWKGLVYSFFKPALRKIPIKISHGGYEHRTPLEVAPKLRLDDEAIITFTSGTSGTPKMLVRDFQFMDHQFDTLREVKKSAVDEVELLTLPAFLFLNLAMGSTSVLADFNKLKPHRFDPKKIAQQISAHQVSAICASPSFLLKLGLAPALEPVAKQIQKVTTGGSPVFPDDAERLCAQFPEASITVIYGSSEAEPISVADGSFLAKSSAKNGLFVGEVHPETKVHISQIIENQPIGEILVTGPNVMLKGDRNKLVVDGTKWHRTGDSGFVGEDGALYLTGPVAALVDFEGRLWSPFVFEGQVRQVAGVERATLVELGGRLVAAVVAKKTADLEPIESNLRQLGVPFQAVVFLDTFPNDPRHDGKIKYDELEKMIKVKMVGQAKS